MPTKCQTQPRAAARPVTAPKVKARPLSAAPDIAAEVGERFPKAEETGKRATAAAADAAPKSAVAAGDSAPKNRKDKEDVRIQANLATHIGAAYELTEENLRSCLADFLPSASRSEMLAMCQSLGPVKETYELTAANLAKKIEEFTENSRKAILAAMNAISTNRGCTTPAEKLVTDLLFAYEVGGVNPNSVASAVEEFQTNYEEMLEECARFVRGNVHAFKGLCAEMAATATA